jgi:cold shock protein
LRVQAGSLILPLRPPGRGHGHKPFLSSHLQEDIQENRREFGERVNQTPGFLPMSRGDRDQELWITCQQADLIFQVGVQYDRRMPNCWKADSSVVLCLQAPRLGQGTGHQSAPVVQALAAACRKRRSRMPTGKVKWFNDQKGFGFIAAEQDGRDVFVHHTVIEGKGFKTLEEGETVDYDAEASPKGLKAVRVRRAAQLV